jgi:hypothetical protein
VTIPTYNGLLNSARFFADRALRDYINSDHRGVLLDAGTFVEHVSKAFLLKENPSYLAELKLGFDHVLHLTGRGDRATKKDTVRTIGANEAVKRVRMLLDIETDSSELNRVLEVRNGTVHAGLFDETGTRQLLTVALRYCDEVYEALGVPPTGRYGDHDAVVDTLVEQAWTDVEHEVLRQTEAARARLHALMIQIPESERAAVAEARQSTLSRLMFQQDHSDPGETWAGDLVDCPVCKHPDALVTGPLRLEQEMVKYDSHDHPEDLEITGIWIDLARFTCGVCGLTLLREEEVRHLGLPACLEVTENIRSYLSSDSPTVTETLLEDE